MKIRNTIINIFVMTFLCHCILLVSCGNNNGAKPNEIQISLKDLKCDTIKVAESVKNLEIIPLEDKPSFMICDPSNLIITQNGFFIYDYDNCDNDKILYFDNKGKALNKIGSIGHGRGEYVTIWDTATDRNGDTIIVTSLDKHLLYDKTGKYLMSKEFGFNSGTINRVAKTSSMYICSTEYFGAEYQLHVYDKDLNLIDELLPTNGSVSGVFAPSLNKIQANGNKVYYLDYHTSTFYCLDLLNKKDNISYHFIDKEMVSFDKVVKYGDDIYKYSSGIEGYYLENETLICHLANTNQQDLTYIKINTKTNEVRKFVYDGWMPLIWDYYDGHNYVIMDQTEFLECLKDEEYYESEITKSEFSKKLKQVYKSSGLEINEKSNYVILKF